MKYVEIRKGLTIPEIAVGLMRIDSVGVEGTEKLINKAMELGTNFFDNADIYGSWGGDTEDGLGLNEVIFGQAMKNLGIKREDYFLTSKCGIVWERFEGEGHTASNEKDYILKRVDRSLKGLQTDYLDFFILHRPDTLVDPEAVADAFTELKASGKVRYFGVSDHTATQIQLLKTAVKEDIIFDQLHYNPKHAALVAAGLANNNYADDACDRTQGTLDYCRINGIGLQAWSALQSWNPMGSVISDQFPELAKKLDEIGGKYGISRAAVVTAWILRHPAFVQVLTGTSNIAHFEDQCQYDKAELTRAEWYEIYKAAGNNTTF